MRATIAAALLGLLLATAGPARAADDAPVPVHTVPVSIKVSQPTDAGDPVALDGGVTIPESGCPCPGVIINHGFLGSWKDSGNVANELASHGYVVLRYSSRGFGQTPGEVDLIGPKERQDLLDAVHWLNDPQNPVVGGLVEHNRIGQFGGSYGGGHAWALAMSGDPAVRTVIPTATWSDFYQALMPNDVQLQAYTAGFYATGLQPVAAAQNSELSTTNNYSTNLHRWIVEANTGVNVDDMKAGLDARSVAGNYGKVKIPVFIIQGTNDGLFSANQAIDAYQALTKQGNETRLYLGGIGHPPSESSLDSPEARHVETEVLDWLDRWLKNDHNGIDRAAPIEVSHASYFHNKWDGTTRSAKTYPFGPATRLHLCTTGPRGGTLSPTPCPDAPPAGAVNGYAGRGTTEEPVTSEYMEDFNEQSPVPFPDLRDAPPALTYESAPAPAGLDLVGVPKLRLQVAAASSLPAGVRGGAAAFQLDPKFYDVAPDGKATLITRGAYSEPLDATALADPRHTATFDAYGLSYELPAGHRLRLILTTEDAPYLRPTVNPFAVALFAGSTVDLPSGANLRATRR
jgi:ABC-2 type transport system ATP-binding protein